MKLFASSVSYPMSLVSTVSSINGSQLIAAQPPRMPIYKSWIDVFKHHYESVIYLVVAKSENIFLSL